MRRGGESERLEPRAEAFDVARHHRAEIGVQHHRRQPLELAELRRDLVAGRKEGVGQLLTQDGERALLVLGPHEAVKKGYRDRLHAGRLELARGGAHGLFVECRRDLAGMQHAFGHFEPQVARHQNRRFVDLDVVEVGPLLPADLQQVAEALGGDQAGLDATMLDQRVGRDRRAVAEIGDARCRLVACVRLYPTQAFFDALGTDLRRAFEAR